MQLCKWHTFWKTLWLICCFIVILFYIKRKLLLLWESQPGGEAGGRGVDGQLDTPVVFPKLCFLERESEILIFCDFKKLPSKSPALSGFRKLFSPHPNKSFLGLLQRYAEIYRHLLSKCFKNAVLRRLEIVERKCFFLEQPEASLLENLWSE